MSGWNHVKSEYYAFEAEIIILPLATEAEMKNGVAYKANVYFQIKYDESKWPRRIFSMKNLVAIQ